MAQLRDHEGAELPRAPHDQNGYPQQSQAPRADPPADVPRVEEQRPDNRPAYPAAPPHWPAQQQAPGPYPHAIPGPVHTSGQYVPQHTVPPHAYPPYGYPMQPPPMQPDPYRTLPYPAQPYYQAYPPAPAQAPATRQRTAIACKYCRKRKIRCSGFENNPEGRCQNCVRFNQQCLFHPVSSQSAFVPASALYGTGIAAPSAAHPEAGVMPPGPQHMQLYGAHGQPLGMPQPVYPPGVYQYPQPHYAYAQPPYPPQAPPPNIAAWDPYAPPPPPPTASSDQTDRTSLKRGPPSDDGTTTGTHVTAQSPHPNSRPRNSFQDTRGNPGSFEYAGQTSPATSTMSYQFPATNGYNANHTAPATSGNSPPTGQTPNSGQTPSSNPSFQSPNPVVPEARATPPHQPGSAGSSQNGRNMRVHEMLSNPQAQPPRSELRVSSDNDMLNKLDRKKQITA